MSELMRWDPFRDIVSLREEMDRLFDSMLGRYPRRAEPVWTPPVDVEETDDAYVVRVEIPGMRRKDIKVQLAGNELCISGERRHEAEEKGRTFHRVERAYGLFQRSLTLPADVKQGEVKAKYRDGILELVLPKSEAARTREIAIEE